MFVWLLLSIIYYFFFFYPIYDFFCKNKNELLKKSKVVPIIIISLFIIIGEIIYIFISKEKFIYYWDYSGFYQYALEVMDKYKSYHISVLRDVYETSIYSDYGRYIPALIAYPLQFTQARYIDFIILLYVMFGIPFSISFSILVMKITKRNETHVFISCILLSLITPGSLYSVLKGFHGIAAFIPILCSLHIFFEKGMKNITVKESIVLSFSLIFSFILRRYFCFYVLAFVFASICSSLISIILGNEVNKTSILMKTIKNYLIVGCISLATIVIGLFGIIKRIFLTNYASLYIAYKNGNLSIQFKQFYYFFGAAFFILFLCGLLYSIIYKKEYIPIYVFSCIYEIVSTLSFYHVQSAGEQHYWIFYLPILLGVSVFIFDKNAISYDIKSKIIKFIRILSFVVLVLNSIYVYTGSFKPNWKTHLFQKTRYCVRQRNDIDSLKALGQYLNEISNGRKVYITASSGILNSDIIRKLYLPKLDAPFNLGWTSDVDQRDGFSIDFLNSDIVVTTEVNQLHLKDENQRCITVLNESVKDENNIIGRNFIKDRSFYLDNGVIATIYIRKNPLSKEEIDWLEEIYDNYHPDLPEQFKNRFEDYKERYFSGN